jgi:hypothetical protein
MTQIYFGSSGRVGYPTNLTRPGRVMILMNPTRIFRVNPSGHPNYPYPFGALIKAVIDTGAATNVMSHSQMQELGLKITKGSKTQLTLADGIKKASMGKASIEIEIGEYIIPVQVEVIESKSVDLLLGTELLSQIQGKIDFEKNKLTFQAEDDEVEIPIYYTRKQILRNIQDNEGEDSEEEFEETDYERDYESDGTEEELHTIIEDEETEELKQPVLAQTVERP